MRNLRNSKGFTLIELMIVVVIIGILAAIAIPKFTSVSVGAKQAEASPVLKQICSLAESFQLKNDEWPSELTPEALPGWTEPNAQYFDFSFDGGTATAEPGGDQGAAVDGLGTQTMDCETGEISEPVVGGEE